MNTQLRCVVARDYEELSRVGADVVEEVIAATPTARLLVATGNTPMGLYQELARRRAKGTLDTSKLQVFQLDEYVGLDRDDRRSLFGWTKRSFIEPLGVQPDRVTRFAPENGLETACREYDAAVDEAGGIDLAILGLGPNGHLGFNEPPSDAHAPTRVIDLTMESIHSNAEYWGDVAAVPRRAMTAGMNVILASRRILLLVSGERKRSVLQRTVAAPPSPEVPASLLQRANDVTVIADRDAWGAMPLPD